MDDSVNWCRILVEDGLLTFGHTKMLEEIYFHLSREVDNNPNVPKNVADLRDDIGTALNNFLYGHSEETP